MTRQVVGSRLVTWLQTIVLAVSLCLVASLASRVTPVSADCPTGVTYPGNEAPNSTIHLQMPFLAGEAWTVGGGGSFYGNGKHCNDFNDHYATDWNRNGDLNAAVLAVADGIVGPVQSPPCPFQGGLGCTVTIEHANGYRTV
jgi:hypothetical protein